MLGTSRPFLKLADLVAAPPLPALLSILMALGVLALGRRVAAWLRRSSPPHVAAGFVAAAGLIASVVHALAWAGWIPLQPLRVGAWALAVLGLLDVPRLGGAVRVHAREWIARCREDRLIAVASVIAALGALALALAALGPATDADSLDYHLGVPLDWIRNGGAVARSDWMNARLVGVGDMLNLLGLAAGTDGFGAAMQLGGLVACTVAVSAVARSARDRLLAALLVFACPVPLFLATSQKPQLLLVAATTIALVITVTQERLEIPDAILIGACLGFAAASKYSFLLTAAAVAVVVAVRAHRQQRLLRVLGVASLVACAVAVPQYARNAVMYGDPLTPMLERFRSRPDPVLVEFARYLRTYGAPSHSAFGLARGLIALVIPPGAGQISTALGIGVIAVFFVRPRDLRSKALFAATLLGASTIVAFGQITGRFFLEPYLWAGAAFVAAPRERWKAYMAGGLSVQAVAVGAAAVLGALVLAPGALTPRLRDATMRKAAYGYAEAAWLDAITPNDSIVLTSARSRALIPRQFVAGDRIRTIDSLARAISRNRIDVVVSFPAEAPLLATEVYGTCRVVDLGSASFREATRNAFNSGGQYTVRAVELDRPEACAVALERRASSAPVQH